MGTRTIHECECEICQNEASNPLKEEHHLMNVFMSRLDEQERRWYAALEAKKLGHGGIEALSRITGLNDNTIRRGQNELSQDLSGRPSDRVRLAGGGRKTVEKKVRR